jgi:hypothetical protein
VILEKFFNFLQTLSFKKLNNRKLNDAVKPINESYFGMKGKIAIGLVNLAAAEASYLIFGKLIEK